MAHTTFGDRVKETTTTTGTGTIDLGGAVSGYQTFVDGIGNGHYTYYSIFHQAANEWEVGLGVITDAATDTLSRDTVISSSNAGSLVNFSAGTKDVICTQPASKSVIIDGDSNVEITANISATSFDGSGASLTNINASNVASGTLPDARFPATLPAASGANLTGLNASNLASGTVPDARFPATIPASSGANLTNLNASNVSSGTLSSDRLPTVPTTKGGTGLTTIGTANQVLAVNGTGTGLEYQTISADITGVTAGSGLTGGGTSGDVTLNVGAGTGVTVNADDIAIGQDVATSATPTFAGANFTANVTLLDNDRLKFGTSADLLIYHNGSDSFIQDQGTGNLVLAGQDIRITNPTATESIIQGDSNGGVRLYYDNAQKLTTTSTGISVTGNVVSDGLILGDNERIRIGASEDLAIYHDGSNSIIQDSGTGDLLLRGTNVKIQDSGGTEDQITVVKDGAVSLSHNGSTKLATTSSGISVTGTVVESSSIDYKENVQPLDFNDAIYSVNAVKYDRKDGSSKDEVGVIAEELYKVLPDLVECKDGKPDAVKYTKMTMYLLEALKKQNQEIQELKKRLN